MQKISLNNVNLDCFMQQVTEITNQECHKGVISMNSDGRMRFEELATPQSRWSRNPHIFEGKAINMARRKDGSVKFNFKTVNVKNKKFSASDYAFRVYSELLEALNIIAPQPHNGENCHTQNKLGGN